MYIKIYFFLIVLFFKVDVSAQVINKDIMNTNCINLVKSTDGHGQEFERKPYFYTNPIFFQVQNSQSNYASFQLEKRKRSDIFIYIKLFVFNTCINGGDVVEVTFSDNYKSVLKNIYPLNCDGFIVVKLRKKDINCFKNRLVKNFRIYTFQKDYEFIVSKKNGLEILQNVSCIQKTKF